MSARDYNWYRYAVNSPVSAVDPSGLDAWVYLVPPAHLSLKVETFEGVKSIEFGPAGNGLLSGIKNSFGGDGLVTIEPWRDYVLPLPSKQIKMSWQEGQKVLDRALVLQDLANKGVYRYSALGNVDPRGLIDEAVYRNCILFQFDILLP